MTTFTKLLVMFLMVNAKNAADEMLADEGAPKHHHQLAEFAIPLIRFAVVFWLAVELALAIENR